MSNYVNQVDLERKRGDTFPYKVKLVDEDYKDYNITNCTFQMSIHTERDPVDTSTQVALVNGVIVDTKPAIVGFPFNSTQADQTPGTYYYDIQMTDEYGYTLTFQDGAIVFVQDKVK
jgi:hypothetical protein